MDASTLKNLGTLVFLVLLVATTLGFVRWDRSKRFARGRRSISEPEMGTLVLVTLFLNIAALPYYMFATRGGAKGVFQGLGLFLGCLVTAYVGQVVFLLAAAQGILG